MRVWEFSPAEVCKTGGTTKPVGAMIDLTNGRPGTYTTNLTYTVSAERVNPVDLSLLTGTCEAQSGDILTGTAGADAHITVAAGATITLRSADITSIPNDDSHLWAGITCEGDATIILEEMNTVKGGYENFPGIYIAEGKTLTIKGTGSLDASSNGCGAGIGGGYGIACGNIVIEGGTITATGGNWATGIGGGYQDSGQQTSCGNITISGGNITATGANLGAGIGSGHGGSCGDITITGGTIKAKGGWMAAGIGSGYDSSCGTITITTGVTKVTATAGGGTWSTDKHSIGAGDEGSCAGVIIGGVEGAITDSPYTYTPNK